MLINYKKIGDTLTNNELNAYASLLAHNKILKDSFKLKNGVITGNYGKYTFDLTNASIVDNGILITDETLSNDITVTLENPSQYATYTLHLTVLRYGETSLLDEEPVTETIDLTVDLQKDTAVVIPMTDLQEYDIILFDSSITVKHDLPEIKGAYVTSLALTTDKLIIQNGQSATVTVTALDLDTLPVANKSIKLYKDGTLLDTLTTDSNGQATKTITATSLAEISLVAKYQGTVTSEELVINDTNLFDLSLTSNKDIMQTNETATLTATLTGDDTGLAGETITFEVYHNDTLQETLTGTTDANGVATASYTGKGTGALNIQAIIGERIISSIIYVEDYIIYDTTEYTRTGTGSATSVATNNEVWSNLIDWELTADIKVTGKSCRIDVVPPSQSLNYHLGIGKSSTGDVVSTYVGKDGGGEEPQYSSVIMNDNTYYTVKITKTNGTVKFYFNGTLIRNDTETASQWLSNYSEESVKFTTWGNNTIYMKNLSVKPV